MTDENENEPKGGVESHEKGQGAGPESTSSRKGSDAGNDKERRVKPFDPFRQLQTEAPPVANPAPLRESNPDAGDEDEPDVSEMPKDDPVADSWAKEHRRRRDGKTNDRTQKHITTETQHFYVKRAQNLLARYRKQYDIPDDVEISYLGFANWLLALQSIYTRSTWRLYRNSVLYYLDGLVEPDAQDAVARLRAENGHIIGRVDYPVGAAKNSESRGGQNAKNKAKSISYANYRAILKGIRMTAQTAQYRQLLHDFVEATLVTGLRPVEWSATDIVREPAAENEEPRTYLRVLSAKTTNNRSHSIVRTLDITNIDAPRFDSIERLSRTGLEWSQAGIFKERMNYLKRKFRNVADTAATLKRGKYVITPYTFRHQFIANAKANFSLVEIAAMVGHNDIVTATEHYGRRGTAWGPGECPDMPSPVPSEVSLVHDRVQAYRDEVMRIRMQQGYDVGDDKVIKDTFGTT